MPQAHDETGTAHGRRMARHRADGPSAALGEVLASARQLTPVGELAVGVGGELLDNRLQPLRVESTEFPPVSLLRCWAELRPAVAEPLGGPGPAKRMVRREDTHEVDRLDRAVDPGEGDEQGEDGLNRGPPWPSAPTSASLGSSVTIQMTSRTATHARAAPTALDRPMSGTPSRQRTCPGRPEAWSVNPITLRTNARAGITTSTA